MAYRLSRNLEKSFKDYLIAELATDGWTGIGVEFSTKKGKVNIPVILTSIISKDEDRREIGSGVYIKYPIVTLRIFAENDGQRMDLSDWLLEKLEGDIPYYTYTVGSGNVLIPTLAGQINIIKILRNEHEMANTDPSVLESEDRYRHNITFSCFVGEI